MQNLAKIKLLAQNLSTGGIRVRRSPHMGLTSISDSHFYSHSYELCIYVCAKFGGNLTIGSKSDYGGHLGPLALPRRVKLNFWESLPFPKTKVVRYINICVRNLAKIQLLHILVENLSKGGILAYGVTHMGKTSNMGVHFCSYSRWVYLYNIW